MDTRIDHSSHEGLIYDASLWSADDARAAFGADRRISVAVGGRGAVSILQLDFAEAVMRSYRRGGLVARVSDDLYLWRGAEATRPFREFQLTAHMRAAGLSVPRPLAARYVRSGLGYRAALITERVAASETLADRIGNEQILDWSAIGRAIADAHRAGVWHADLNATNILIDADQRVWLIDLDRGRMRRPAEAWQRGNLRRLLRSLRKLGVGRWLPEFESREWPALLDGYATDRARP